MWGMVKDGVSPAPGTVPVSPLAGVMPSLALLAWPPWLGAWRGQLVPDVAKVPDAVAWPSETGRQP